MGALGIEHLRSPAFAHPQAYEAHALVNFATREGRCDELHRVPEHAGLRRGERKLRTPGDLTQSKVSTPLPQPGVCDRTVAQSLHGLPSTALFRDFCTSVAADLPHQWISGTVDAVAKSSVSERQFEVLYSGENGSGKIMAKAVILATGPQGRWNIPEPFAPFMGSRLVMHTEELFTHDAPLSRVVSQQAAHCNKVLVVGGGLTAAQAALALVRSGVHVVLRSRRPLQTRPFDLSKEWLDRKHIERLRFGDPKHCIIALE